MDFLAPGRLWLLAACGLVVVVYVLRQAQRPVARRRFTSEQLASRVLPDRPGLRRHLPATLFVVALAALSVGFAEPTLVGPVARERATVIIALDTSLSMIATDVEPSRFAAAKSAAAAFVDQLPKQINVGLVAFNGNAIVAVAPTRDRDALKRGINGLQLGQHTAIGEAIFASLEAISAVPAGDQPDPAPARIVLMSDGATNGGRPNAAAAQAAADAHVPVDTIAFGTDHGVINTPETNGQDLAVPVDGDALKQIADSTGAQFFTATTAAELTSAYTNIGSSVAFVNEAHDVSSWFIGAALLVLCLSSVLSLSWFNRLP